MRILLVEDETRLAEALRAGLEAEGYAVDLAHDGPDGLWMARQTNYTAIILDILLPGMNGYRVCQQLRSAGTSTPILMLTAKDGEYDEADALDIGADDFVRKPFSYVVLLARLRALVRRGGSSRPSVLRFDDLSLNLSTQECKRRDTVIRLSVKEFAILAYLLERAGEVVTKSDMLRDLWDEMAEPDPNLIEVYISALRRKIDAPFGRCSIVTVRGAGYRLAPT